MSEPLRGVVDCLKTIVSRRHWNDVGDAELLRSFNETHDSDVFACLMRRHGPMVLGLARRVVRDQQLAEDVFQATFLILARKSRSIRGRETLPAWVHQVALRLANRARKSRQRVEEKHNHASQASASDPLEEISAREYLTILDEEIARLPETFRLPVILCHLEGLSREDAAKRLGVSASSIKGMLERGRQMLRKRLSSRGLPGVALGTLELGGMSHAVSMSLIQTTARAAVTSQGASAAAVALAEGAIMMMTMAKIKTVCVVAALVGVVSFGAGWMALGAGTSERRSENVRPAAAVEQQAAAQEKKEPAKGVDLYGDPLPAGAVMRLGTVRYRSNGNVLGFLSDSKTVVTSPTFGIGAPPNLQFWDASSGVLKREIRLEISSVAREGMSLTHKWLAAAVSLPIKPGQPRELEIIVWDVESGEEILRRKRAEDDTIDVAAALSPDGKILVSFANDVLRFEKADTGEEILRGKFPSHYGPSIAFSPDGKTLAFSTDATTHKLYLWNWTAGQEAQELKVPDRVGSSLAFSPDGKVLIECGDFQTPLRVWDVATSKLVRSQLPALKSHYYTHATFTPDGKTVIATTRINRPSTVEIWDFATWQLKGSFSGFELDKVFVSPDGKLLTATGGGIRVWDLESKKELSANDDAHIARVDRLANLGNLVISAGYDCTVRLWDVNSGKQRAMITHGSIVRGIALSPDGTKFVSSSIDNTVCLWDTATCKQIYKLLGHGASGGYRVVSFTPDGKHFLSWGDDMHVRKWEVATGKAVLEYEIILDGKKSTIDPDDTRGALLSKLRNGEGLFTPDGKSFLFEDKFSVYVFDVETGKQLHRVPSPGLVMGSMAISTDSRLLLLNSSGERIEIKRPDGRVQATAADEHPVVIRELAGLGQRFKVVLPEKSPGPLAFSPDGKMFAEVAEEAGSPIRFWDAITGKELGTISGFPGVARSLLFSSDSTRLMAGMQDTTVLVWDLSKIRQVAKE